MNTSVSYNATIDELSDPKGYGDPDARKEDLTHIERAENEMDIYHYKSKSLWGFCYYHFLVNRKTKKVVGWGFDDNLGDVMQCGNSG